MNELNSLWSAGLAVVVDRIIGDPSFIPHPVVLIGKYITWFDLRTNMPHRSRRVKRLFGVLLTTTTLAMASIIPWVVLHFLNQYSRPLSELVNIFLIATTIAWKGLADAGVNVLRSLQQEGLEAARQEVSMIVGRDTAHLTEAEVVRATVETLAENIVDAIVSPVFFACTGGAPLALLYRSANTLDSMVGYRNERYADFGWCSARCDDVLNFVPARLTVGLLAIAAWGTKNNPRAAIRAMWRDARKHPSPNSGIPESMVAGALGVQLGGLNFYGGIESPRAVMGTPGRSLEPLDIERAIRLMHVTCLTMLSITAAGGAFIWFS